MTIMAVGLRMSSGVMRGRCASGSGTELPRRDKDRSGEYKPDSHDRTSLRIVQCKMSLNGGFDSNTA